MIHEHVNFCGSFNDTANKKQYYKHCGNYFVIVESIILNEIYNL